MRCLWMRTLTGAILLTGVSVSGEPTTTVPVVLVDLAGLSDVSLEVMTAETSSALGPSGIRLSWHRAKPGEEHDLGSLRVIVLGKRSCGAAIGTGEFKLASVLPALEATTLWVCLPNLVVVAASARGSDRSTFPDQHRLGVALGRVIVHELVHLAAPELPHARRGLFSRKLDRTRLVSGSASLDPTALESLRRAAVRWQGPRAEVTSLPVALAR